MVPSGKTKVKTCSELFTDLFAVITEIVELSITHVSAILIRLFFRPISALLNCVSIRSSDVFGNRRSTTWMSRDRLFTSLVR